MPPLTRPEYIQRAALALYLQRLQCSPTHATRPREYLAEHARHAHTEAVALADTLATSVLTPDAPPVAADQEKLSRATCGRCGAEMGKHLGACGTCPVTRTALDDDKYCGAV